MPRSSNRADDAESPLAISMTAGDLLASRQSSDFLEQDALTSPLCVEGILVPMILCGSTANEPRTGCASDEQVLGTDC
jgi:hypothetical protein